LKLVRSTDFKEVQPLKRESILLILDELKLEKSTDIIYSLSLKRFDISYTSDLKNISTLLPFFTSKGLYGSTNFSPIFK